MASTNKPEFIFSACSIQDAYKEVLNQDRKVWAETPRSQTCVLKVWHRDSSFFILSEAHLKFARAQGLDLIAVFPDHIQPMVFAVEDLEKVICFNNETGEKIIIEKGLFCW